ncbi:iron chelate uptake ABC transporter family permease subunit [Enemella evansiae]|uniref:iron chelate uptake ABC transporter family permease subunit n=1 Tax=Enemella evansiae TaxID=2016499 RepID=UPI000B961F79|nr:iron chelate uptake ABC transporter family permease subunit [Enemella evansiae]PFG67318.1 iron complex transport system permease protein [Propionibacteriaceae bacterium ES.041]OYN98382.1 enterobactin ABC transporter permease [Enemella evansiae]OYN99142.1 enterobactin ABC transporter permease [Enemella evansiae]OYO05232.1 enterobactin ABC transporter permease [Enemella evansiae]OYO20618.1 enterobactin ABC transporter permease [Enemella evansiae]
MTALRTSASTGSSVRRGPRPGVRIASVAGLTVAAAAAYLTIGTSGNVAFAMAYRGPQLAAMVLVGWAIALSTVLFHTITTNRILTPAIMGFDALYALLQTSLVFFLGVLGSLQLPPVGQFLVTTVLMAGLGISLFGWIFGRLRRSIHVTVLVGLVLGTLLRSATSLLQRVMDPNAYLVLQSRLFASFSGVDPRLLALTAVVVAVCTVLAWRRRAELDVIALGPDLASSLGVDHRRATMRLLVLVAVLVSVSTALVGPILFFGLLVANLAYQLAGTHRHAVTLPLAGLLAVLTLVGGQTLLQQVFGLGTVLSVVVEFIGGLVFLAMLIGAGRRKYA